MLRLLWNRMSKEEKGFTLIELLVVIVILGVLAGIGVPTYRGFIDRSHKAATIAELQAVSMAIKFYFMEYGEESFKLSELGRYLDENDFAVDEDDESEATYLDYYTLKEVSGQDYISATTSEPNRKSAWIYIKDIKDNDIRRGDIEIVDSSE